MNKKYQFAVVFDEGEYPPVGPFESTDEAMMWIINNDFELDKDIAIRVLLDPARPFPPAA